MKDAKTVQTDGEFALSFHTHLKTMCTDSLESMGSEPAGPPIARVWHETRKTETASREGTSTGSLTEVLTCKSGKHSFSWLIVNSNHTVELRSSANVRCTGRACGVSSVVVMTLKIKFLAEKRIAGIGPQAAQPSAISKLRSPS
jgi:hypothetical protein